MRDRAGELFGIARCGEFGQYGLQPVGELQGKRRLKPKRMNGIALGKHLLRRALEGDAPPVHDNNAPRNQGIIHKVRDVHDGDAPLIEVACDALNGASARNIQHCGRFIEHEYAGMHGKRARDGDTLTLTARKVGRVCLGVVEHVHRCQRLLNARGDLRLRHAEILGSKGNVVCNDARHHLVIGVLKHHRDLAAQLKRAFRLRCGVDTAHASRSACGRKQCINELRER